MNDTSKSSSLVQPDNSWWDDDELTESSSEEEDELQTPPPAPPVSLPQASTSMAPPPPLSPTLPRVISTRPSTRRTTQKSLQSKEVNRTSYLSQPKVMMITTHQICSLLRSGSVNLNPDYQRDIVWNDSKQTNLIDSLHHNYYVPPLIFSVTQTDTGGIRRVCIDGKQRLTSIRRFMDGEIPRKIARLIKYVFTNIWKSRQDKDSVTNQKSWYGNVSGTRRKLVSQEWKEGFEQKTITVVDFDNLLPEQEREIFQRVQLGVTLTPAERLQAINGPYADVVRDIRKKISSLSAFSGYSEWGSNRGKDFQTLSQIVFLFHHIKSPKKIDPTVTRLETFLHTKIAATPGTDSLRNSVYHALDIFCRIIHHPELGTVLTSTTLYPLEFVMICFLIHCHKTKLTDCQLGDAIHQMRTKIRSTNGDARSSAKVFGEMHKFVKDLAISKLRMDGSKVLAADEPSIDISQLPPDSNITAPDAVVPPGKTKKRSRKPVESVVGPGPEDEESVTIESAKKSKVSEPPLKRSKLRKDEVKESDDEGGVIRDAPPPKPPPKPRTSASRGLVPKLSTASTSAAGTTKVKRGARSKANPNSRTEPSVSPPTFKSPVASSEPDSALNTPPSTSMQQITKPTQRPSASVKTIVASSPTTAPPTSTSPLSSKANTIQNDPVTLPNVASLLADMPAFKSPPIPSTSLPARAPLIPLPSRSRAPSIPRRSSCPMSDQDLPDPTNLDTNTACTAPSSTLPLSSLSQRSLNVTSKDRLASVHEAKRKVQEQNAARNTQEQYVNPAASVAQQPTPPESVRRAESTNSFVSSSDPLAPRVSSSVSKKLLMLNLKFTKKRSAVPSAPAPIAPGSSLSDQEAAVLTWKDNFAMGETDSQEPRRLQRADSWRLFSDPGILSTNSNMFPPRNDGLGLAVRVPTGPRSYNGQILNSNARSPNPGILLAPLSESRRSPTAFGGPPQALRYQPPSRPPPTAPAAMATSYVRGTKRGRSKSPERLGGTSNLTRRDGRQSTGEYDDVKSRDRSIY